MAFDPSQAAGLISAVGDFLPYLQTIEIIFLILFAGGIAGMGVRLKLPFWKKFPLKLGSGALSVFIGSAIAGFITFEDTILKLVQAGVLISVVIASLVVAIGLYMITRNMVVGEKGLKKQKPKKQKKRPLGNLQIIGIIILAVSAGFGIVFYHGFPDVASDLFQAFGIPKEGLISTKPGCAAPLLLAAEYLNKLNDLKDYQDSKLQSLLEQETQLKLAKMAKVGYRGGEQVIAMLLPDGLELSKGSDITKAKICTAKLTEVCSCTSLPTKIGLGG